MSLLVKILVSLGLVLPLGAFVAGSLATSGHPDPGPRETIVIRDAPSRPAAGDDEPSASPDAAARDHGTAGVITPSPDDLDDPADDSGRDGDHGDHHGDDHGDRHGDDHGDDHPGDDGRHGGGGED